MRVGRLSSPSVATVLVRLSSSCLFNFLLMNSNRTPCIVGSTSSGITFGFSRWSSLAGGSRESGVHSPRLVVSISLLILCISA